ncbi:alpha/beta-hydrolase [Mytilinidion resinicola]|uniref:Alpha/beta-hydrolase n=1 Tax=Mytilinidion resinicola TaxID=574789 RepID=A0A6A6YU65_9PEZI|nr:alpha/beta-hydrolase [Mytilinidion resinicola]KAF2812321.1 alpha/beta-hydrolase [Mytilinidion resinicola]
MSSQSDLALDHSKFASSSIPAETKKINAMLEAISSKGPHWNQIGSEKYQQMREAGETPLPPPIYLPEAQEVTIPSRDPGRTIPLRVYKPDDGQPSRGIFLHFHGGGFVLGNHQSQDRTLKLYANSCHLTAISVGYRHAPSIPYPGPIHDCIDAAEYLVDHASTDYGVPLIFMGGESAGACAAVLSAFHLIRSRSAHELAGLILPYGWFDMSLSLPSIATCTTTKPRVINLAEMRKFRDAYLPGAGKGEMREAKVSPLFEDFSLGKLPPALFLVGSEDPLVDDTLLMGLKWMAAGAEAVVRVWPGCPHGFTAFPGFKPAEEAAEMVVGFLKGKLEAFKCL